MVSPSGLSDGTSSRTTLSSRRFVSASFAVASACAHSIAIWLDAISDEWMLQVTRTMALPSRASCVDLLVGQPARIGELLRRLPDLLQVPHVPLGARRRP